MTEIGPETSGTDGARSLVRLGVSQATTAPWPLDEDVSAYAASGCAAIGIWLHKLERRTMQGFWFPEDHLADDIVDAAAAAVAGAGLEVSHVVMAGRFTEADEDLRLQRVKHATFATSVAHRLGARCLVVIPGRLNGLTPVRATDITAASLADVLEATEGVPLAIEPVHEVDFVTTLGSALDLADLVDHPRLGVYPDAFHLWRDPGIAEALERAGDRILGVHVADGTGAEGDRTRLPPGEGVLPLHDFVAAVEAAGYAKTYDVELFAMGCSSDEARSLLERSLAGMRELVPAQREGR